MHSAIISGTVLGSAPQVRFTTEGTKLCEFILSVPAQSDREAAGTMKVTVWNTDTIEWLANVAPGQAVLLEGRISIETVDRQEGFKESRAVMTADRVHLVDQPLPLNVIHLIGRTGQDPEIKFFESGAVTASVSLAVNVKRDVTAWFNIKAWSRTAQVCADYVHKGKQIAVQGSLYWEVWTDRNTGAHRSKPVIRVNNLELLGGRNDNAPIDRELVEQF